MKTFDKKLFILIIILVILTYQYMAFGDLVIEIKIKNKGKIIAKMDNISNDDILDMEHSGIMYLEKRIGDLGFKVAKEVFDKKINNEKNRT